MKIRRKTFKYSAPVPEEPQMLNETMSVLEPPPPLQVNVRAAKNSLSSLLEEASRGHEIIITSDGKPKAKLFPVEMKRKRFKVDWEWLLSMPVTPGPTAEQLIREDRDGRP